MPVAGLRERTVSDPGGSCKWEASRGKDHMEGEGDLNRGTGGAR